MKALRELYLTMVPLAEAGLCGAVYTQLSDVEDETNGLFTFDRAILKLRPEELTDIAEALSAAATWARGTGKAVVACGSLFLAGEVLVALDAYPWRIRSLDANELLSPLD